MSVSQNNAPCHKFGQAKDFQNYRIVALPWLRISKSQPGDRCHIYRQAGISKCVAMEVVTNNQQKT